MSAVLPVGLNCEMRNSPARPYTSEVATQLTF
jgi:hypothetical protein